MTALAIRPATLPTLSRTATLARVAQPLRRGRALHLVDLENLMGTPSPAQGVTARTWASYRSCIQPGDQVVVATSHHTAFTAWFELPRTGIQLVVRSGRDGADLALLDSIDLPHAASRFEWLVLASGDGIFASTARQARLLGMRAWQVTGTSTSSRALTRACQIHSHLNLDRQFHLVKQALAAA
jgi:hypothetical protein